MSSGTARGECPVDRLLAAGGDFEVRWSGTRIKILLPLPADLPHPVHSWMSSTTVRPEGTNFRAWMALAVEEAFAAVERKRARRAARLVLKPWLRQPYDVEAGR